VNEECQVPGDFLYLSDLSPKDKPWDKHGLARDEFQSLCERAGLGKYALRVKGCSPQLRFAFEAQDSGEMRTRLKEARFCRVRFCPVCQWRKSLVWRARLINAIPEIVEDYPKSRWIFVTFTLKNCPVTELRSTIDEMNRAWKRLVQRKEFPAIGFFKALEVTREKGINYAHPHFHVLMMVKPSYFSTGYIPHKKWVELWGSCLGVTYSPSVVVQTVKDHSGGDSVINAVLETAKYSVKEQDLLLDVNWTKELISQMHKVRCFTVGGILREYLKEAEPDDLINVDDDDQLNDKVDSSYMFWVDWFTQQKRYIKRNGG
jgi:plasmid rolling circle replication initiator protein Rep